MPRRYLGGVFGDTIASNTTVHDLRGVFSMSQQYHVTQEGGWIIPLGGQGNPAGSAEALRLAGQTTNGVYYINTPDGGEQQVYCMFTSGNSEGGTHGWMLVGRYAANAMNTVRDTLSSQRSMVDVSQNGTSMWSADWGTYMPSEVRVIGCSNSDDWMNDRTTDWIYGVPSGHNLIRFLTNQTDYNSTSTVTFGTVPSGGKQGMKASGARDGRGRWTNTSYTDHRISDSTNSNYSKPGYFKAPGTDMWHYHAASDAKWSVSHSDTDSGQDDAASALFGYDDNTAAWFDNNQSEVTQATNRIDSGFNTAAFVFIR